MKAVVAVVGEGILADLVCKELSGLNVIIQQINFQDRVPKSAELVMVLSDDRQSSAYRMVEEMLQANGIPWITGFISNDEGVVGPLVRPGTPGCAQCAVTRRQMAGRDNNEMSELQMRQLVFGEIPPIAPVSHLGLLQMSHLLAAEAHKLLQGGRSHLEGHVYLINLKTLKSSLHFFLPDSLCPICGQLPDDSPEAARISLKPNPKLNHNTYRSRPIDDLTVLVNEYYDDRTGVFNKKRAALQSPFADVYVNMPLFMADEVTAGRTHSYAKSELTAILEGLERYSGRFPRGKRTVIHDSFRSLADQALNPVRVGLYAKEQYAQPNFPFEPFDPDHPIDWVWGYSFLQERPILVPESLAYYSISFDHSIVQEASNGCAIGGSLVEAIFHGVLEVVERDSFLMAWYAQLPVPGLDPRSVNDKELQLMIDRLQIVDGYDVHLFNTTTENGIPSIWAVAKNRTQKGINLICSAGAHLDPVRAVKSAIHELGGMMPILEEIFEANRAEVERMLYDSSLVQGMEDHSLLYGLPQAEERLHFLLDNNRPIRRFDEEFKQKASPSDLTDELKDVLQRFRRCNLDVIVVDQTSPETLRNGLYCVKVLIPGMLPMTFGHVLKRVTGLDRVLKVPMELGYKKQGLTLEQLNPHPHPFP